MVLVKKKIKKITPISYKKKLLLIHGKQLIAERSLTRRNPSLALVKHHVFLLLSWKYNRVIPTLIKRRAKYIRLINDSNKIHNNNSSITSKVLLYFNKDNILFTFFRRYYYWVTYKRNEFLFSVASGLYLYFLLYVVFINDNSSLARELINDFNQISAIYFCYLW
jgi:hypothetical protein